MSNFAFAACLASGALKSVRQSSQTGDADFNDNKNRKRKSPTTIGKSISEQVHESLLPAKFMLSAIIDDLFCVETVISSF